MFLILILEMPAQGFSPSGDLSGKIAHFVRKHRSLPKYTEINLIISAAFLHLQVHQYIHVHCLKLEG